MASWGSLASEGAAAMEVYPWLIIFPGSALTVTLLSLNFLGDGLRDTLDPQVTARRWPEPELTRGRQSGIFGVDLFP